MQTRKRNFNNVYLFSFIGLFRFTLFQKQFETSKFPTKNILQWALSVTIMEVQRVMRLIQEQEDRDIITNFRNKFGLVERLHLSEL